MHAAMSKGQNSIIARSGRPPKSNAPGSTATPVNKKSTSCDISISRNGSKKGGRSRRPATLVGPFDSAAVLANTVFRYGEQQRTAVLMEDLQRMAIFARVVEDKS